MNTSDFSLKLIAASCLLIVVTDSLVLQEIIEKARSLMQISEPQMFVTCFEPQVEMRIIFTLFAINAAGICFFITTALMIFDEYSQTFEDFLDWIFEYLYFIFGPVMLTLCILLLTKLPSIA